MAVLDITDLDYCSTTSSLPDVSDSIAAPKTRCNKRPCEGSRVATQVATGVTWSESFMILIWPDMPFLLRKW